MIRHTTSKNPLESAAGRALHGDSRPLLNLAHDGAKPGAPREERRLGLVARLLVELTHAALYGGIDGMVKGADLHQAVVALSDEMRVEAPITAAAEIIAHGRTVDAGDRTAVARLITAYPTQRAWFDVVRELYVWSQE